MKQTLFYYLRISLLLGSERKWTNVLTFFSKASLVVVPRQTGFFVYTEVAEREYYQIFARVFYL